MTIAEHLVEKLFSFYEEATSPDPKETGEDMLDQVLQLIPTMEPGMFKEFSDFVQWIGAQRYGLSGTTEEILHKVHPWVLQLIVQRFRLPAASPKMPGMA